MFHPCMMGMISIQVLMKDIVTPVPPEEVRGMIKKCLENAALLNYTRLSAETRIEGLLLIALLWQKKYRFWLWI